MPLKEESKSLEETPNLTCPHPSNISFSARADNPWVTPAARREEMRKALNVKVEIRDLFSRASIYQRDPLKLRLCLKFPQI